MASASLRFEVVLRSSTSQEVTIGDLLVDLGVVEGEEGVGDLQVYMETGMIAQGLRALADGLEEAENAPGEFVRDEA